MARKASGRPNGRPPSHTPDEHSRNRVIAWVVYGHRHETIAGYMGITLEVLEHQYKNELACAKMDFDAAAVAGLYKGIRAGEQWAVQYYLRTKGKGTGWSERIILTGDDNPFSKLDMTRLTAPEFRQFVKLLQKANCDLTLDQEERYLLSPPKGKDGPAEVARA